MGDHKVDDTIRIPRRSFTAFRLTYCTSRQISKNSEVILLGPIPNIWVTSRSSVVLKSMARLSHREKVKDVIYRKCRSVDETLKEWEAFDATSTEEEEEEEEARREREVRSTISPAVPLKKLPELTIQGFEKASDSRNGHRQITTGGSTSSEINNSYTTTTATENSDSVGVYANHSVINNVLQPLFRYDSKISKNTHSRGKKFNERRSIDENINSAEYKSKIIGWNNDIEDLSILRDSFNLENENENENTIKLTTLPQNNNIINNDQYRMLSQTGGLSSSTLIHDDKEKNKKIKSSNVEPNGFNTQRNLKSLNNTSPKTEIIDPGPKSINSQILSQTKRNNSAPISRRVEPQIKEKLNIDQQPLISSIYANIHARQLANESKYSEKSSNLQSGISNNNTENYATKSLSLSYKSAKGDLALTDSSKTHDHDHDHDPNVETVNSSLNNEDSILLFQKKLPLRQNIYDDQTNQESEFSKNLPQVLNGDNKKTQTKSASPSFEDKASLNAFATTYSVPGASSLSSNSNSLSLTDDSQKQKNNQVPKTLQHSEETTKNASFFKVSFANPEKKRTKGSTISKLGANGVAIKKIRPKPLNAEHRSLVYPVEAKHYQILKRLEKRAFSVKHKFTKEVENLEKKRRLKAKLKNFQNGSIIKVEKMLVLVKTSLSSICHTVAVSGLMENEGCDTRVVERWKEYIVVVRSTGDLENPLYIQFYRNRKIPEKQTSQKNEFDFKLNIHTSIVKFYSSLDKTISITMKNSENGSYMFYILRTSTQSSAIRWHSFFQEILGYKVKSKLRLDLPELDVSMNISIPYCDFERIIKEGQRRKEEFEILVKNKGYKVEQIAFSDYLINIIAKNLKECNLYHEKIKFLEYQDHLFSFAWKHYDRLEWIFGENQNLLYGKWSMGSTHTLEFRSAKHYPTTVLTTEGRHVSEPIPIEGFLGRLTSRSGKDISSFLKKPIFKLKYFYTNDNMLMFCKPSRAIPPLPESIDFESCFQNGERLKEVINSMPAIYQKNPFKLDDNDHIEWLKPGMSKAEFIQKDRHALQEMERKISAVTRADGLIDMCQIIQVKSVPVSEIKNIIKTASSLLWTSSPTHVNDMNLVDACFDIILNDGGIIRLQAPSRSIKYEWIAKLIQMRDYWIQRKKDDLSRLMRVRQKNMEILHASEYVESTISHSTPKWETSRGIADSYIYNVSGTALSRCVVMSGILYQKPKKHSVFTKYFVVLCPGFIILYSMFKRNHSGFVKSTTDYRHYLTIPVHESYVYSGMNTTLDLLDRNEEFDEIHPGHYSLPRIYPDFWKSSEEESERCFTLWFGTKRAIAGKKEHINRRTNDSHASLQNSQINSSRNPGLIRMVNRLGVTGRSIVFMARSRQERDLWVTRLLSQIERFAVLDYDEIKLVH